MLAQLLIALRVERRCQPRLLFIITDIADDADLQAAWSRRAPTNDFPPGVDCTVSR